MIGNTTANVFTACDVEDNEDPRDAFDDLLDAFLLSQPLEEPVNFAFDRCLDNAEVNPGNGTSTIQGQSIALQEKSFTTNVVPEAGISTFSSPSAQGTLFFILF